MQRKNTHDTFFVKTEPRLKSRSLLQACAKKESDQLNSLIQFNVELSPIRLQKITVESFTAYARELVAQVYESDPLGTGKIIEQFLRQGLQNLRHRIQQRISLLNYLVNSLKFKSFAEIQIQILKQWKKNLIFASINTIWATKMRFHKFTSVHQFTQEYKKQVSMIANLTHFYFKNALSILDGKNMATFCKIRQDTAHKVLNSLRDWNDLYNQTFLSLLRHKSKNRNFMMNLDFDPKILNINSQYLDLQYGKAQLVKTTEKIMQLSKQTTIHAKLELLKQIRTTFIKQIEESRDQIFKNKRFARISALEKDDIIGCMIYCIIQGQIAQLQWSIEALSELLGPNSYLLSRKGVDSYRADLESAVEYLCQQAELNPKQKQHTFLEEQVKTQNTYKSTQLQQHELE